MSSPLEWVFLTCAVLGGAVFVLRALLLFVGIGDVSGDVDVGGIDADVSVEVDVDGADLGDTTGAFEYISIQGVTGFFTMFGIVGLAAAKSNAHDLLAIGAGLGAGIFTMWVVGRIFQLFKSFQSSGTMDVENAVGKEGSVYLTIPSGGTGKVQVEVQGRMAIFNAVSDAKKEIPTGTRVSVTEVRSGNILVVKKA